MKQMRALLGVGLLAMPLMVAGQAQAALSVGGLIESGVPNTLLSDNSADFLINVDGSVSAAGTPTVTTGDIFISILGINSIEPGGGSSVTIGAGSSPTYNEVTAIVAAKISTASDVDLGPAGPDDSFGVQNIDLWQFEEAPLTAADAIYFDWSTGLIDLNGVGTGPDTLGVDQFTFGTGGATLSNDGTQIGLVFEDGSLDYTRDGTLQDGLTSATNGDLRLVNTLDAANSDHLAVVAPVDLGSFLTVPLSTAIDNTNINLDLTNDQIFSWHVGDNITAGNGGFSSPTAGSGYPVFDNLDFTLTPAPPGIPEPSTIILMGLGLVGLAGIARKRA